MDIVVNNAGYFPNRSIDELDLPTWRKTMATNLDSHFLSAKYFLPAMRKKKWGRFVGISSNMVGLAIPGMSHYIATKMGIIGFMRGLANDVANDGITANAVLPGLTNTLAIAPQSEEQKRATWEQQAIKRLGEPEDVTGRNPVLDERRCCIYYRAGHRRRRRSVSDRLAQGAHPKRRNTAMSYSISTLLTRNLHDVFGENDPARRRAAIDEIFTEDCVFYDPTRASTVAATRSIASRARSGLLTLTFDISQLPSPRKWAMAGGSNG